MKIVIESTKDKVILEGVPCRVWKGVTAKGVACLVFVHRLAIEEGQDSSEMDRDLEETSCPETMRMGDVL